MVFLCQQQRFHFEFTLSFLWANKNQTFHTLCKANISCVLCLISLGLVEIFHTLFNLQYIFEEERCWSETYLVPLFTAWYGASERLLVASVHAHRTEDGLRTDGALCSPRLITVRLLKVYILLITLATCERVKDRKSNSNWLKVSLAVIPSYKPFSDLCTLYD